MSTSIPAVVRSTFLTRFPAVLAPACRRSWHNLPKSIARCWSLVATASVLALGVCTARAQDDGPTFWTAPFPPVGAVQDSNDPSTATITEALYVSANHDLVIGPPPGEGANLLWRRVDTFHFDCSKQVWKAVGVQWFGAGAGAASNASGPASSGPPHGMENYFPADSPPGPPPGSQLDPSDPSLATNPQTGTTYLRGKDRWVEAKTGKVLGAPQICTAGGLAYTPPPEAPSEPDKVQHKWREKEPDTERKSESSPTVVGIDLGVGLAKYSGVNDCSSWSAVYPRNSCSSSQTPSTYRAGADVQMGHFQVSAGYSVSGEATRNASAPLIGGVQGENSTFNTQFGYLLGGVRFPTDLGIAPYADLGLAFWKAALNATQSVTNASGTASASSSASLSGASFAFGAGLQYQFSSQLSVQLDYLHFQASKSPALAAQENMLTLDLIVTPF